MGLGFRVWGSGFSAQGLGLRGLGSKLFIRALLLLIGDVSWPVRQARIVSGWPPKPVIYVKLLSYQSFAFEFSSSKVMQPWHDSTKKSLSNLANTTETSGAVF